MYPHKGYHGQTSEYALSSNDLGGRGRGASYGSKSHRRREGQGGQAIVPNVWKGKAKELAYHQIPLARSFPRPSKWIQDELILEEAEATIEELFEGLTINVILEELVMR